MKTVLITGAYRGLGFETGRQFSERGWKAILTARRREQGAAAAAKLKNATFLELDISDSASVADAARKVSELDVLIAGPVNRSSRTSADRIIVRDEASSGARHGGGFAQYCVSRPNTS